MDGLLLFDWDMRVEFVRSGSISRGVFRCLHDKVEALNVHKPWPTKS